MRETVNAVSGGQRAISCTRVKPLVSKGNVPNSRCPVPI